MSLCRNRECSLSVMCCSDGAQDPVPLQQLPASDGRLQSSAGHHVPAQVQVKRDPMLAPNLFASYCCLFLLLLLMLVFNAIVGFENGLNKINLNKR